MATTHFTSAGKDIALSGPDGDWVIEAVIRSCDFYEIEMLDVVATLDPRGWILDIGAQIGNHTTFFGSRTKCAGVISLEPNPHSFSWLEKNIEDNGFTHVRAIQKAAGAEPGTAVLDIPQDSNSGMARIGESENGVPIEVTTIDDVVGDLDVSLIKIDVEGFEVFALRGAAKTLARCQPHIFVEAQTEENLQEVQEILYNLGYVQAHRYNATSTLHFAPLAWLAVDGISIAAITAELSSATSVVLARTLSELIARTQAAQDQGEQDLRAVKKELNAEIAALKILHKDKVTEMGNLLHDRQAEIVVQTKRAKEFERKYLEANNGLFWQVGRRARAVAGRIKRKVMGGTKR